MAYRSHTPKAVADALTHGRQIWALDTCGAGEDDVLIGTETDCLADVLHHHGLDALPAGWSLEPY